MKLDTSDPLPYVSAVNWHFIDAHGGASANKAWINDGICLAHAFNYQITKALCNFRGMCMNNWITGIAKLLIVSAEADNS